MGNVAAIVRRDVMRLLRVPAAWIIVFGMVFLPPLYAWFNIIGFWDPYGNTNNVHVSIANEDEGARTEVLGTLHLGDQIVKKLKSESALGWQFTNSRTAMKQVESGESYAAIVIPKDFSARISGLVSGSSKRPKLEYYVNEKANGIATKITDTGATTVDMEVNNTFVSTVSAVISKAVNTAGNDINAQTDSMANETIQSLQTVQRDIHDIRSTIDDMHRGLASVPQKTQQTKETLHKADAVGKQSGDDLQKTSTLITNAQSSVNDFIGSSTPVLDNSSALLSQASAQTNLSVASLSAQLTEANGHVSSALSTAKEIAAKNEALVTQLQTIQSSLGLDSLDTIIASLQQQNSDINQSIDNMATLNTDTGSLITSTTTTVDSLNTATQSTLSAGGAARQALSSGSLPQLDSGLASLAGTASTLGSGLSNQSMLIAQSNIVLDQLNQAVSTTDSALSDTDKGLGALETKLDTITTDLGALTGSNTLNSVFGIDGTLNVANIANFMLSPTVLETKIVYPVASYGSGMAPLFTNLSLWVGAFMLVVLMKLQVDDDDLNDETLQSLTSGQRYWGRWGLLAVIAALQGLVTTLGDLIIGVQSANPFMFVTTGVIAALVYVSITYALSVTFMHIGKVLCIALVMVQIPGSSGLYPIEMMPGFFRAMNPLFPFTYAVNALRETIGGFYGNQWLMDIGKLLLFAVAFFAIGLLARPYMAIVNRLFSKEIDEGDMIINESPSEKSGDIGRRYSISQAIRVLADEGEYQAIIERKAVDFASLYPKLKRGALIVGIAVPIILGVTFSLTNGTKLVALAAWIIFLLLLAAFLMGIELMRDSIARQVDLGTLSKDALRSVISQARPRRRQTARARRHDGASSSREDTQNQILDTAETEIGETNDQDATDTAIIKSIGLNDSGGSTTKETVAADGAGIAFAIGQAAKRGDNQ